jgi:hypothetical protein
MTPPNRGYVHRANRPPHNPNNARHSGQTSLLLATPDSANHPDSSNNAEPKAKQVRNFGLGQRRRLPGGRAGLARGRGLVFTDGQAPVNLSRG